jgi:hypothetical protein
MMKKKCLLVKFVKVLLKRVITRVLTVEQSSKRKTKNQHLEVPQEVLEDLVHRVHLVAHLGGLNVAHQVALADLTLPEGQREVAHLEVQREAAHLEVQREAAHLVVRIVVLRKAAHLAAHPLVQREAVRQEGRAKVAHLKVPKEVHLADCE